MFTQFVLILFSIITSIVLIWAGVWSTWAYYAMELPLHDVFSFVGPFLVVTGIGLPVVVVWEI